jgi:hypothetical protein
MFIIYALFISCALALFAAGLWRMFEKAGKPGWAALVPVYNAWLMVEIVKKPVLWFILLLVPCVSIVFTFLLCIELAKVFGKSAGFGVGMALLPYVFMPIVGLGDAQYRPELGDIPTRRPMAEDEEEDNDRPRRRPRR